MTVVPISWRRRQEARVRAATAPVRGAALAAAAAAAAIRHQLTATEHCPDDDPDCLTALYAALQDRRRDVDRVTTEVERLERTQLHYDGRVPADAPRIGGHEATVIAARNLVDRAHDVVVEALDAVATALAHIGHEAAGEPAVG